MYWIDIASIVFVCVTMNHLGLIGEIEGRMGRTIPVLGCPKCASFWLTLAHGVIVGVLDIVPMLAISFLASYLALWLELFEGYIDTIYIEMYDKIYPTSADAAAADTDEGDTAGSVSELQENNN